MDCENPEDFAPALTLTEEEQQGIGGLINSDGEEVNLADLSEQTSAGSGRAKLHLDRFLLSGWWLLIVQAEY